MKDSIGKSINISKVEFWAATSISVFALFFLTATAVKSESYEIWTSSRYLFEQAHVKFNYNQFYFFPQIVRYISFYLIFLLLNFRVVPDILKKQKLVQNILLLVVTYLFVGLVLGVTDTYLKNYLFSKFDSDNDTYNYFFQNSYVLAAWIMLLYGLYTAIKYAAVYLIANSETIQSKYQMVTTDGIIALVLWMISVFLMVIIGVDKVFISCWVVMIPFAIGLYWFSFYTYIPQSLKKKKPFADYLLKVFWIVAISVLPLVLLGVLILGNEGMIAPVIVFNSVFQLVITAPVTWYLYKRRQQGTDEVQHLKTALGQSAANLDFLRSQINPHFLFNSLNTIYGTALQEDAQRTSEGVERLGDMMRFMLQENIQEKISLNREIDYLNNYISLQKLRTDTSPDVKIETDIDQAVNTLQISPMLLIPFVENAFKHGISLREPSHIRISLQIKGNTIYLDINNSIHLKPDTDPEKNKSGIGLNNVRQRLKLLYPGKHELIIRETAREFYVHLTMELEAFSSTLNS